MAGNTRGQDKVVARLIVKIRKQAVVEVMVVVVVVMVGSWRQ